MLSWQPEPVQDQAAGDRSVTNDFVQVIRVADGRVSEVWNYHWDQRALAEAFPVAA